MKLFNDVIKNSEVTINGSKLATFSDSKVRRATTLLVAAIATGCNSQVTQAKYCSSFN